MSRKKWILAALMIAVALLAVGGRLIWALYQVPEFYTQAASALPVDPQERKQSAKKLVQETTNLVNLIEHHHEWSAEFEEQEVNSWLAEELTQRKYQSLLPEDMSDPRVRIENDVIHVGFKMKYKAWNGIASVQVRPWITDDKQLALEVEQIRAGLLPIPLEDTLRELGQQLTDSGFQVVWRQSAAGNDVAVISLSRRTGHALQLDSLRLKAGVLQVIGRSKAPGKQFALTDGRLQLR